MQAARLTGAARAAVVVVANLRAWQPRNSRATEQGPGPPPLEDTAHNALFRRFRLVRAGRLQLLVVAAVDACRCFGPNSIA